MQCTETPTITPQKWVNSYIKDSDGSLKISRQDLKAVLNLLYLSYARSNITLTAQDDGLNAVQQSWQAFQNIIQLRRNPSKELPYAINEQTYTRDTKALYGHQKEHRQIGTIYSAAVENILHGSMIDNEQLKKGLEVLKDESRRAIIDALSNVQQYLDILSHIRDDIKKEAFNTEQSNGQTRTSIGDYVLALIPNFAVNSFVQADDLTMTVSEESWKAMYQVFNISNIIWKSVERARAELYLAYYKAVYLEAESHNIDVKSMTLMFDEHGLLDGKKQRTKLPHPKTLHIHA